MLRKILIVLVLLVLVAGGGLFTLVATNSDIIVDKFNAYVENSTGAPLVSEKAPELTLFPTAASNSPPAPGNAPTAASASASAAPRS